MRFIRKNGRVIPINDERVSGVGHIAAGSLLASGAGALSGRMHRDAAYFEHAGRKSLEHAAKIKGFTAKTVAGAKAAFQKASANRLATKNFSEANRMFGAGKTVQYAGLAASTALIGTGVYKILPHDFKRNNENAAAGISVGAGLTSAALVRSAYYNKIGGLSVAKSLALGLKRVAARGVKL